MSKSPITTERLLKRPADGWKMTAATHPGEMLHEEFMKPLALTINGLARELDIPVSRLHDVIRQRRGITADTAIRLSQRFGTTAEFWLGLQSDYDLVIARKHKPKVRLVFKAHVSAAKTRPKASVPVSRRPPHVEVL